MPTLILCIGTQKAGTTWLSDYFRARGDIHAPPVKEVHYFDARFAPKWCGKYEAEMLENFKSEVAGLTLQSAADAREQQKLAAMLLRFRMISNPADYMRFMMWGAAGKNVLFEATPDYMMVGPDGFRAMREVNNDVRLILLMRNPADRFWSSLRFNKTHVEDFDIDRMFDRLIEREDFILLADYGRAIRLAQSVFDRSSIHLEFYERLFTPEAIARLCKFVGVPYRDPDFGARSNAAIAMEMTDARRLRAIKAYGRVYREISDLFSGDIPETWLADLQRS